MSEEWREVDGYPGYEVSSCGRVKSNKRKKAIILKPALNGNGYQHVTLMGTGGKKNTVLVHKLVALAFLGPRPEGKPHTRHRDGDQSNNASSNLVYGTVSENQLDAVRHGTHSTAKLSHEAMTEIREAYATGGYTQRQLAAMFGVSSHASIQRVLRQQNLNDTIGVQYE